MVPTPSLTPLLVFLSLAFLLLWLIDELLLLTPRLDQVEPPPPPPAGCIGTCWQKDNGLAWANVYSDGSVRLFYEQLDGEILEHKRPTWTQEELDFATYAAAFVLTAARRYKEKHPHEEDPERPTP